MSDVTRILSQIEQGDSQAADELLPLVYDEPRKLAAAKLAQEKPGQTLQATALVHEAYIRLVDGAQARHWDSRWHFFAAAAERFMACSSLSCRRLVDGAVLLDWQVERPVKISARPRAQTAGLFRTLRSAIPGPLFASDQKRCDGIPSLSLRKKGRAIG